MAEKKAKKGKSLLAKIGIGGGKKKSGGKVKLDVGEFRDKTKDIEVVEGETTVAEALKKAGYSIPTDKTAKEEGWRLNGKVCSWTDVITGKEPTLYRLPRVQAGR